MGCIYRIVCYATGRSYIGQTSYSHPFERFRQHQTSARKGEVAPLYDDMRKYTISDFECICICCVDNEYLNNLESYYAEQYNAYVWDGGYNTTECGNVQVRQSMTDDKRNEMRKQAIRRNIMKFRKG